MQGVVLLGANTISVTQSQRQRVKYPEQNLNLYLLSFLHRVNYILTDYFPREWGLKAEIGRKGKEPILYQRSSRVAPTVKTLTTLQAVSCFSSWILGSPTA